MASSGLNGTNSIYKAFKSVNWNQFQFVSLSFFSRGQGFIYYGLNQQPHPLPPGINAENQTSQQTMH